MGMLYNYQNVYEEAIHMHEKAYQYKLLAGDSATLSLVTRDIARVYEKIGKEDSAVIYYQEAANLAKNMRQRHHFSGILTELGDLYRELALYDKALSCLYESSRDSLNRNMYPTYSTLGHIYLEIGKLDSADYYLRKCLDSPDLYVKASVYKYLSFLSEYKSAYKASVRYARLYQETQDSIQSITASEEIRKMASLYNYQKREKENLHLREVNDRVRIQIYQVITLLGMASALMALFVYRFKRQKDRAALQVRILSQEKQEQYERSLQCIEENNAKMANLELLLSQKKDNENSLLQVRKELLQVTNERIQLKRSERDLLEIDLRHSDIYQKFHSAIESDLKILDADWQSLQQALDLTYDNLTERLCDLYSDLSSIELRICYLIKVSIRVTDMAILLNRSKSSISSARSRLYYKLTGEEGTPNDLDQFIVDF